MLNLPEKTLTITTNIARDLNFSYLPSYEIKPLNTISLNRYKKLKEEIKLSNIDKYKLAEKCEDGVMFHAWNWSFNAVRDNLEDLAESGFTSVQVSPIQPNKGNDCSKACDWWTFYQPTDFSIGNVLGSASDFENMCTKADKLGIKIIVDVVANHLANNTGNGNHAKWDRCDKIPAYLKDNDSLWHDESNGGFNYNDNDRTSMTQGAIGMPGLNTRNKELQNIIVDFINNAQDLGASGFRFDAAKHIELPTDQVSSDFWPTITDRIKAKDSDSFIYGEILNECGTDIKNYTKYLKVTDNQYGWNVLDAVLHCNAGLAQNYYKQDEAKNFITWVESHDTFAGDYGRKSDVISDEDIKLGWCLISARADSIPLFFNRPSDLINGKMGEPGDTSWKSKTVSAANKFHNHFAGQNEYIRILNHNTVFEIERGDSGVVIVNLSYNNTTINTETTLKDGQYTDRITGKKITVSNGQLNAELSGKSVIIAYNEVSDSKESTLYQNIHSNNQFANGYLYATKPSNWGNKMYAYVYSDGGRTSGNIVNWPGIEMECNNNEYFYELPKEWQNDNTKVIFNDGNNQMPMAYSAGENYQNGTAMHFNGQDIIKVTATNMPKEKLHDRYLRIIPKQKNGFLC